MKKETIVIKFAANLAWLPALASLTLIDNDINTFADVSVLRRFIACIGLSSYVLFCSRVLV
jgi:hypothetical protein